MIFHIRKTTAMLFTLVFSFLIWLPFLPIRGGHPSTILFEVFVSRIVGPALYLVLLAVVWLNSIKTDEKGLYSLWAWGDQELTVANFMDCNEIGSVQKPDQRIYVYRKNPVETDGLLRPSKNSIIFSTFFDHERILRLIHDQSDSAVFDPKLLVKLELEPKNSMESQAMDRFQEMEPVNRKYRVFAVWSGVVLAVGGGLLIYEGISCGLPALAVSGMAAMFAGFIVWVFGPLLKKR